LMTVGDFLVEGAVTELRVALCRDGWSVHQPQATERVSTDCLISAGSWAGSFPTRIILRCGTFDKL
jgi:hypothetical protein